MFCNLKTTLISKTKFSGLKNPMQGSWDSFKAGYNHISEIRKDSLVMNGSAEGMVVFSYNDISIIDPGVFTGHCIKFSH